MAGTIFVDMRPDLVKHKHWSTETGPKPKMIPGRGNFFERRPSDPAIATTETQGQKSKKCELGPIFLPSCSDGSVE